MSTKTAPPPLHRAGARDAAEVAAELTGRRTRPGEVLFKLALQFCLLVAFAFLIALITFAVYKGWNRLDPRLWENMPTGRASRAAQAGVQSAITGTLWVVEGSINSPHARR